MLQEYGEGALESENLGMTEDRGPIRPMTRASVARNRDCQIVVRGVLRFVLLKDPNGQPDVPPAQFWSASYQGTRIGLIGSRAHEVVQHGPQCGIHAAVTVQHDAHRDLKSEELLQ